MTFNRLVSVVFQYLSSSSDMEILHVKNQGPHSDFPGPTSGCTACVAVIRNRQLIVANAGDSRCVLSRKGQVRRKYKIKMIRMRC